MRKRAGVRFLAGILAAGLMMAQPAFVSAAEPETETVVNAESELQARIPDSEEWAEVSEEVRAMLEEGSVYLEEGSGYLYDTATGQMVHPVSGERSDVPGNTGETENSGDAGENGTEENPGSAGDSGAPGNPGNAEAQEGETGASGDAEETGKPGESDTGNAEKPGDSDTGNAEKPGESDTGNAEKPGDSGTGAVEKEKKPGTEDADASENVDSPKASTDGGQKDEADADKEKADEEEKEEEPEVTTNEQLIAKQQIVKLPVIVEDFRFWTVARKYAFAKKDLSILEEMKEKDAEQKEMQDGSQEKAVRTVGTIEKDGLLYVLKEEADGWVYVESGAVRGFVKAEDLRMNEEAQTLLKELQKRAKEKAEEEHTEYTGIETVASIASEVIPRKENNAFLHLRATVNQTVVEKEYALANADELNIREGKGTDSRIVGILKEGNLCYLLADQEEEWIYVESGDVRGFVKREYLDFGEETDQYVEEKGEDAFDTAEEKIKPEENDACYYTLTSVRSGVPGGEIRSSLLEFASQFIGNPYVWGGTSLTDGADCSGFVQSIYREYGYNLPRVAEDQAQFGTQIAVEDAEPGDLIFYAKNGAVYHVVIYAGDGKTIEAMDDEHGIVQGKLYTKDAVWAVRVLEDERSVSACGGIGEVNASEEMYGESLGTFKITYYCSCELCCDVETGITATGTPVVEGQTIAVDPTVIPYGTQVIINGHVFTAEDCGGAIKGNKIDIYVSDHEKALALGVGSAEVHLVK